MGRQQWQAILLKAGKATIAIGLAGMPEMPLVISECAAQAKPAYDTTQAEGC